MTPQTFIFVGRSGSGKGTQMELLQKKLTEKETDQKVKTIGMGDIFRAFFAEGGYVQDIVRESINSGKFQPDFITNALFISNTIRIIDATSHLFFEGFPRSVGQLAVIKELCVFTKHTDITVINIDVSREEVKRRLLARGRTDDTEAGIESRLSEYDRTILPMLEVIKGDSSLKYIELDGMPSIEAIHTDLLAKLSI